jgi:phytanoyl-CoA hydroxylase
MGESGRFRSRFGGLWIDRVDADDELVERVGSGALAPEMAAQIVAFVRDGWIILPGAVPLDLTRQIRAELDDLWATPPPGALVETYSLAGTTRYVAPSPAVRRRSHKLLDLHAHSAAARRAIAAPAVVAFLSAVFDARPKAFQSLTFERGSQQDIHKDTAYVRIEDEPMHLAASWIALEDVKRGSGELQYFTGSHHDPEFLFGGRHKWMVDAPDDHGRFLQSLQDDALRNGRERTLFRPKEGDVLIWHADLAHGGARIRRRWRTRQSLVTHFTPEPCNPPYASAGDHVPVEADGCLFLSEHGQIDLATSVAPLS